MKASVLIISGLLAAAPALAQSGGSASGGERAPAPEAGTPSGAGGNAERQICRRIQADTGTRISKTRRVCMTAREWREFDREN